MRLRLAGARRAGQSNNRYSERCPTTALKLPQIGNSVGVILPTDVLARLKVEKVEKGEALCLTNSPDDVLIMMTVAAGELSEADFAQRVRTHSTAR